jgi:hypothetical protein
LVIEQIYAKCSAFYCFLAVVVQKLKFLNNSNDRSYFFQPFFAVSPQKTGLSGAPHRSAPAQKIIVQRWPFGPRKG